MNFILISIFFTFYKPVNAQVELHAPLKISNSKTQEESFKANLKALDNFLNEQKKKGKYSLVNQVEEVEDCRTCPKHLTLVSSINKVLEKMKNDSDLSKKNPSLPHKITKLKFLYYTVKSKNLEGIVKCQNFGYEPFLYPHQRLKGESEFVFEDVFKYESVDGLTFYSPNGEETLYYYRGDGDEKDLIIEARVGQDRRTTFKYYKYIPDFDELKNRNLPDIGESKPTIKAAEVSTVGLIVNDKKEDKSTSEDKNATKLKVNFEPKFEMRHKIIPKDFKIGSASMSHHLTDELQVVAQTEVSLAKGNKAKIDLRNGSKSEAVVELSTSLNGETKYVATVPYEIKVPKEFFSDSELKAQGAVTERSDSRSLSVYLTDHKVEVVRADLNHDKMTGRTSAVLTKTVQIDPKSNVVVQAGTGNQSTFVSAKHSQEITKSIGAVLDFRYDVDKKASLFYTINARF